CVSFPGGLTVSSWISSWRSSTASSRSEVTAKSLFLLRELRQLVPHVPELGIEAAVDEAPEELDRRALRADDLAADDPLDDLEVADAPDGRPLVPFGEQLGELVQILELAPALVDLDDREARLAAQLVEDR